MLYDCQFLASLKGVRVPSNFGFSEEGLPLEGSFTVVSPCPLILKFSWALYGEIASRNDNSVSMILQFLSVTLEEIIVFIVHTDKTLLGGFQKPKLHARSSMAILVGWALEKRGAEVSVHASSIIHLCGGVSCWGNSGLYIRSVFCWQGITAVPIPSLSFKVPLL